LSLKYLEEIVQSNRNHTTLYTVGTEPIDWHFELSDLVLDMIVVKGIFKLSIDENFKNNLRIIFERLNVMTNIFTDFVASFIRRST
jgi:hypothetical protein